MKIIELFSGIGGNAVSVPVVEEIARRLKVNLKII